MDGNVRASACFDVEHIQLAVELVDNAPLAIGAGPAHIPCSVPGHLRDFSGSGVIGIEVEVAVAIGIEVDLFANPHGVAAGAWTFSDALGGVSFGIENVKLVSLSAA